MASTHYLTAIFYKKVRPGIICLRSNFWLTLQGPTSLLDVIHIDWLVPPRVHGIQSLEILQRERTFISHTLCVQSAYLNYCMQCARVSSLNCIEVLLYCVLQLFSQLLASCTTFMSLLMKMPISYYHLKTLVLGLTFFSRDPQLTF